MLLLKHIDVTYGRNRARSRDDQVQPVSEQCHVTFLAEPPPSVDPRHLRYGYGSEATGRPVRMCVARRCLMLYHINSLSTNNMYATIYLYK